jgi:hypothetical protein
MDAALLAIILGLAMLAIVPFMLLILRARDSKTARQPLASGPSYTHDPKHADYYRSNLDTNPQSPYRGRGRTTLGTCHCRNVPSAVLQWVMESRIAPNAVTP